MRRALVTFAAFVAILAQTFIVQTHVDFTGGDTAGLVAVSANGANVIAPASAELKQAIDPTDDSRSPCVICQTLATAGAAVMGVLPVLLPVQASASHDFNAQIPLVVVRAAHSWQSRAPPISL